MNKLLKLGMIFVIITAVLTGCWSRRELNDLAIAIAIGIDKGEDGNYLVSTQIVNPAEIASKTGSGGTVGYTPVSTYQTTAGTIMEAMRQLTTVSPRKIYVAHIRMLVIGEEVAKDGLKDVLDFFSRDHEFRTDFFIVVTKDTKAEDVLSIFTQLEKMPANKMFSSLEMSEKSWAPTRGVFLDELINDLVTDGKEPVLTAITVKGEAEKGEHAENVQEIVPDARLKYENLAVFKGDKLIGWLDKDESKGLNYVTGKVENTVGPITCPNGGELITEQIRTKSTVKGHVKDGKPEIYVDIWAESNIAEVSCQVDLTKPETITELEKIANKRVEELAKFAIEKAQKDFQSDIFGFGDVIYRKHPKEWKKLKKNWDETFASMPIHVNADFRIRRLGTVGNSFLEEMELPKSEE
ncbi:Ger(x)C family spore germination protein [Bacillus kexueae]|uniref:Ger(x)C family spore germination protein n=1 Tax=Aeribacillus kexueae TaxID=2078952 RepID=UPI001FAF1E7F|nr:Ger(x)C family spore germination protein [Bacillus kexueae]